jgi:hypothetical protein
MRIRIAGIQGKLLARLRAAAFGIFSQASRTGAVQLENGEGMGGPYSCQDHPF